MTQILGGDGVIRGVIEIAAARRVLMSPIKENFHPFPCQLHEMRVMKKFGALRTKVVSLFCFVDLETSVMNLGQKFGVRQSKSENSAFPRICAVSIFAL